MQHPVEFKHAVPLAIALFLTLALGQTAFADKDETRLSLQGGGALATLSAFASHSDTQLHGGSLAIAHGLQNWLDVGFVANYQMRSDVLFAGGTLGGVSGDLYTDLQVFETAVTARAYLDVGPFLRLRPLLGLRLGAQAAAFTSPAIFVGQAQAWAGESEWKFSLLKGAEAGAAYRLTDSFEMALLVGATSSDSQESFTMTLEFSWQKD